MNIIPIEAKESPTVFYLSDDNDNTEENTLDDEFNVLETDTTTVVDDISPILRDEIDNAAHEEDLAIAEQLQEGHSQLMAKKAVKLVEKSLYFFIDVETQGSDVRLHRVIQIGLSSAIEIEDGSGDATSIYGEFGREVGSFEKNIDQPGYVTKPAMETHGLDGKFANADNEVTVLQQLLSWMKDEKERNKMDNIVIVCHRSATDFRYLCYMLLRNNLVDEFVKSWLCTDTLQLLKRKQKDKRYIFYEKYYSARTASGKNRSHKLEHLVNFVLNLRLGSSFLQELGAAHQALPDARGSGVLFFHKGINESKGLWNDECRKKYKYLHSFKHEIAIAQKLKDTPPVNHLPVSEGWIEGGRGFTLPPSLTERIDQQNEMLSHNGTRAGPSSQVMSAISRLIVKSEDAYNNATGTHDNEFDRERHEYESHG
eukprot:g82.t1